MKEIRKVHYEYLHDAFTLANLWGELLNPIPDLTDMFREIRHQTEDEIIILSKYNI